MNKVFFLGILWASHTFSEPFEISDVDVTTYQVFNGPDYLVPQAIEKPSCMSVMCNQTTSIDIAPKAEVPAITPITENTSFETLGEVIFFLGEVGFADRCIHPVDIRPGEDSACQR